MARFAGQRDRSSRRLPGATGRANSRASPTVCFQRPVIDQTIAETIPRARDRWKFQCRALISSSEMRSRVLGLAPRKRNPLKGRRLGHVHVRAAPRDGTEMRAHAPVPDRSRPDVTRAERFSPLLAFRWRPFCLFSGTRRPIVIVTTRFRTAPAAPCSPVRTADCPGLVALWPGGAGHQRERRQGRWGGELCGSGECLKRREITQPIGLVIGAGQLSDVEQEQAGAQSVYHKGVGW